IVRDLCRQGIGILLTDHNVRETLKITDRSYLIKDGQVRTHGSPQHIIHDPVAIAEYLGNSFNDNTFVGPPLTAPPPAAAARAAPEPAAAVHQIVEQEKVHRLIERLKTDDRTAAAAELVQRGPAALPALLEMLERRDVDLRRHAFEVMQRIWDCDGQFDPYAP